MGIPPFSCSLVEDELSLPELSSSSIVTGRKFVILVRYGEEGESKYNYLNMLMNPSGIVVDVNPYMHKGPEALRCQQDLSTG